MFSLLRPTNLSNRNLTKLPDLNDHVTRSFDVGLRIHGTSEKDRLENRFTAYNIVQQLQYEAYDKLTDDTISKADQFLRVNPKISGVQGSAKLRKELGDCSNLGETSYLSLLGALKGLHKLERKLKHFLTLSKEHPEQFFEWLLLERSPYLERLFQYKIYSSWDYARNVLIGARRNIDDYLPDHLQLNTIFPELDEDTWLDAFDQVVNDISLKVEKKKEEIEKHSRAKTDSEQEQEQKNNKTQLNRLQLYLSKLEILHRYRHELALFFHEWVYSWNNPGQGTPKSRWKHLSQLSRTIEKYLTENTSETYKKHSLRSAVRNIVMTAYQSLYQDGWSVNQLVDEVLDPARMVNQPFTKKNKKKRYEKRLPLLLVMGSKYVVERAGNKSVLTKDALTKGKTRITIYPPRKKRLGVQADIIFHQEVRGYLEQGVSINSLILSTKTGPSFKVRVQVSLSGKYWMFLDKKQVLRYVTEFSKQNIHFSQDFLKGKGIGLDVNKIGPDMLSFSEPYRLTNDITSVQNSYLGLEATKKELGKTLTRSYINYRNYPSVFSKRNWIKIKTELELVHSRRNRLLKKIHDLSRVFVTAVLVDSETDIFSIEDLRLSAKGTRGALAKAILSMPDGVELFEHAVSCAQWIQDKEIMLKRVNPAYTSKAKHLDCLNDPAGSLKRHSNDYDHGTCSSCGQEEKIHVHASRVIRNRGYKNKLKNPDINLV